LPNWIKAANVVVFPSLVESFGYVGLETSLLNVPLVASNMGAIPEIVF
jgi:glycosyltransferase involved in cell wall biosynthesis